MKKVNLRLSALVDLPRDVLLFRGDGNMYRCLRTIEPRLRAEPEDRREGVAQHGALTEGHQCVVVRVDNARKNAVDRHFRTYKYHNQMSWIFNCIVNFIRFLRTTIGTLELLCKISAVHVHGHFRASQTLRGRVLGCVLYEVRILEPLRSDQRVRRRNHVHDARRRRCFKAIQ